MRRVVNDEALAQVTSENTQVLDVVTLDLYAVLTEEAMSETQQKRRRQAWGSRRETFSHTRSPQDTLQLHAARNQTFTYVQDQPLEQAIFKAAVALSIEHMQWNSRACVSSEFHCVVTVLA